MVLAHVTRVMVFNLWIWVSNWRLNATQSILSYRCIHITLEVVDLVSFLSWSAHYWLALSTICPYNHSTAVISGTNGAAMAFCACNPTSTHKAAVTVLRQWSCNKLMHFKKYSFVCMLKRQSSCTSRGLIRGDQLTQSSCVCAKGHRTVVRSCSQNAHFLLSLINHAFTLIIDLKMTTMTQEIEEQHSKSNDASKAG